MYMLIYNLIFKITKRQALKTKYVKLKIIFSTVIKTKTYLIFAQTVRSPYSNLSGLTVKYTCDINGKYFNVSP